MIYSKEYHEQLKREINLLQTKKELIEEVTKLQEHMDEIKEELVKIDREIIGIMNNTKYYNLNVNINNSNDTSAKAFFKALEKGLRERNFKY